MTVYQVFLSGGNPFDSSTWLKTALANYTAGNVLELEHAAARRRIRFE